MAIVSLDLNHCDYFLWEVFKGTCHLQQPKTVEGLRAEVHVTGNADENMMAAKLLCLVLHLQRIIKVEGSLTGNILS
jgi:hypothetical protein